MPIPAIPTGLSPERLARVLDYIQRNLHESLSVQAIAQEAGLSPFHFSRMFKRATRQTPHAFITARRMELACQLLGESTLEISEITRRCGFRTQAHFTEVFRLRVGTTPKRYRESQKLKAAAQA